MKREELAARLRNPVESPAPIAENKEDIDEIIRIVPKKPSWKEKLFARIIIVAAVLVVLTGILTFWYWYFKIRTQPPIIENGEEIEVPVALFEIKDMATIDFSNQEDLLSQLKDLIEIWHPDNRFKRIILKRGGKIIGLKEFLENISADIPFEFFNATEDNLTLFMYSQPQGNKLGFAAKVKNRDALSSAMSSSEESLEGYFGNLFSVLTVKTPIQAVFKNSKQIEGYSGPDFRFKAIANNDLGICYHISDHYFIFSSSFKSMEESIAKLSYELEGKMIVKDLKVGDQGRQVELLQKWLANDIEIYPEKLINGSFGEVTKKAVIRFQERYSREILEPQQLKKGTGIVDLSTREKLNGLYSEF